MSIAENISEQTSTLPTISMIYTASEMGAPMEFHSRIRALAGIGLEGDRYALKTGAYSEARIGKKGRISDEDRQVTLFSLTGLYQANLELTNRGLNHFNPWEIRRNLLLAIDPDQLNSFVGQHFRIGDVEFEGIELCTPCTRPAIVLARKLDGKPFEEAFNNRGGIRARIINDGWINVGDKLFPLKQNDEIKQPIKEEPIQLSLAELTRQYLKGEITYETYIALESQQVKYFGDYSK